MSGWDWLHAGLEVATYAKARDAQRNLAEMKSTSDIESARKFLIEAMRGFVFDISRDIQLAEENMIEHPQQVYVIARSLEWRLEDSGLTPEVFSEFSDKDYVLNTQKKISSVISASKSKLNPTQFEQSENAVRYITEMPLLQDAIRAKSSLEQIQATEEEWKEVNNKTNGNKTKRNFGVLGLIVSPCFCLLALGPTNDSSWAMPLAFLVILGGLALLFAGSRNVPRFKDLKDKRESWQKYLLHPDTWKQVIEKFGGDLTSVELQKNLEERVDYLQPILGNEFQKYLVEKNN